MSDAPIGVLAAGNGGLAVVDQLARALPREDVLFLADHAYSPYAARQPRVVRERAVRLCDDLVAGGAKAVVLASAVATGDALAAVQARLRVPVLGLDATLRHALARSQGGTVALVAGDGCLRSLAVARGLRAERGGGQLIVRAWPHLAALVEAGAAHGPAARELVDAELAALARADTDTLALVCAHACAARPLIEELAGPGVAVVDAGEVVARRLHRTLLQAGLLARRKRPGRRLLLSSHPSRAGAGLR